jgi:hypothetical protein
MAEYKNITPIYNALGKEMIDNLPILDLKNKIGHTGYIDFITSNDMSHNIMKGIDYYKRPFIAFKFKVTNKNDSDDDQSGYAVGTFFQRYTDDIYYLAFGTCYQLGLLFHKSRFSESEYIILEKRIKLLMDNIEINDITFNDIDDETYDTYWLHGNGDRIITLK